MKIEGGNRAGPKIVWRIFPANRGFKMESVIHCPKCEGTCVVVLCWVDTAGDLCDHGEVIEAAGDFNRPPKGEPPQLAMCGDCFEYFGPREGYKFAVHGGKPYEEELKQ